MPLFSNFKLIEAMDNDSSNKPKIVYYYSESCKYCKEFTPIWESFKSIFNESNIKDNFTIEKIEASNINESTMTNLDIKGFPTVLIVKNNEKIAEFDLERTPEKLMEFANNNSS
jgi:thiol-disulfide isomerase/thioredoxin